MPAPDHPRAGGVNGRGLRRLSLRWRLLLIGVSGLVAGLALGGWVLLVALQVAFDRSVDAGAATTATDIAALIAADQLPRPVPVAGAQIVQVVDQRDTVRAGSPGADRLMPLLDHAELATVLTGKKLEVDGDRAGLDGPIRVYAVSAGPASDRLAVIVAIPLGNIEKALSTLRIVLLVVFAPLVAGLASIAWWVIGWTLRPVEALRAGAEEITGRSVRDAGRRLPVPDGGDEIHRLAVTLNRMLDRLDGARRRQRQFVADAAHELRNPLAGLRTQLEVARRHPDGVDWEELTSDLLVDTDRLTTLTNDLLLLAGLDELDETAETDQAQRIGGADGDGADGTRARALPAVPVMPVLDLVGARYRAARVTVGTQTCDGSQDLFVQILPDDLDRVLTNLVDNAVRHARTEVLLIAEAEDEHVRITVTDDGPGIPPADRERVFDRFTRLDDARTSDQGGAGLGLAIVAELIRRNGGTVLLADADPGLRAEIRLPRAAR